VHYSVTATSLGRHAPGLDEHTDEVLAEVGYDAVAVDDLRSRGVVGAHRRSQR
jgi:crotonobetainyl-CoA:carnitine CoA-transferase CaiB-like acyl-CoA transferase